MKNGTCALLDIVFNARQRFEMLASSDISMEVDVMSHGVNVALFCDHLHHFSNRLAGDVEAFEAVKAADVGFDVWCSLAILTDRFVLHTVCCDDNSRQVMLCCRLRSVLMPESLMFAGCSVLESEVDVDER